jgi:hypothetical protein
MMAGTVFSNARGFKRFRPESASPSGLGQRGRKKVLKIDGAYAPKVLGLTAPVGLRVVVGSCRCHLICRLSAAALPEAAKTVQPRFARRKQLSPFGGWRRHLSIASGGTMGTGQCFSILRSRITKLIARRAIPQPSAAKPPSNLRTLGPTGPINLKNLSTQPFYTTRRRQAATTRGEAAPL